MMALLLFSLARETAILAAEIGIQATELPRGELPAEAILNVKEAHAALERARAALARNLTAQAR